MSTTKKSADRKPAGKSSAPPRKKSTTTARRPSSTSVSRVGSGSSRGGSTRAPARTPRRSGAPSTRTTSKARAASTAPAQPSTLRRIAGDWGRYLWAGIVTLVIAALLFEFTMVWTIGVGFYMLALGGFSGLWLLVGGYAMACTPAAFGLLIATGQFWRSLTHSLWIGLLYGTLGFTFLDVVLGAL